MNTEQVQESYESYCARREQELFDARIEKDKSNLEKNRAMQNARFGRFGINRELPRSQEALAVIAAEETRVLGAHVEAPLNIVKEAPKNDAVDDLIDDQCSYIDAEKQAKIDENSAVNGSFSTVSDKVDSRPFCFIAKPFVDDGTQLSGKVPTIEQVLHDHYDLLDTSIEHGAHLSVAEIITKCGLPVNKANSNVVAALLKNTGHNYCKSKGQRGYWITIRD